MGVIACQLLGLTSWKKKISRESPRSKPPAPPPLPGVSPEQKRLSQCAVFPFSFFFPLFLSQIDPILELLTHKQRTKKSDHVPARSGESFATTSWTQKKRRRFSQMLREVHGPKFPIRPNKD